MRPWMLLVFLIFGSPLRAQDQGAQSQDERILQVLSRLTFGPTPGEVARVKALGLSRWLEAQFHPATIDDSAMDGMMKGFKTIGLTPRALDLQERARKTKKGKRSLEREARSDLVRSIILRGRYSKRELVEVLADFWRNHFNVDVSKGSVQYTANSYEYLVLRPHIFGRFQDLLRATAKHPAMLVYLDNWLSRRPPDKAALRAIRNRVKRRTGSKERAIQQAAIAAQTGLNENYARELMELHTLGVDNGYTQKDVIQVAKALTGWTMDRGEKGDDNWFRFREDMHIKGRKRLMGHDLPEGKRDSGIIEGEAILKRLAASKQCAGFIAKKLCIRLVSDTPSPALLHDVAQVFRKTHGDLRATVRAIVDSEEFFSRKNYLSKFKTPLEFVLSALRATGADVSSAASVVQEVKNLGEGLYTCEDPTGYFDTAEAWRDPGVMALRWRFAMRLVTGAVRGVRVPEALYKNLPRDLLHIPLALTPRIIPGGVGANTRRVLERVVFRTVQEAGSLAKVERGKLARTVVGILLGSPEFQQQ